MKKYINDFFEIGFGFDLTKLNTLKYKSYLGIRLNLWKKLEYLAQLVQLELKL